MVQGRVDQYSSIVPSSGLDPDCLVYKSALIEHLVGDHDGFEAKENQLDFRKDR